MFTDHSLGGGLAQNVHAFLKNIEEDTNIYEAV